MWMPWKDVYITTVVDILNIQATWVIITKQVYISSIYMYSYLDKMDKLV